MSTDPAPSTQSAAQIAARCRSGRLAPDEVLQSCYERISSRDPLIRAWEHVDIAGAHLQCTALEARPDRARLRLLGVPVGIKDIIDVRGQPTRFGSPIYGEYRAAADASCVALLRGAGAIILGKTATTEFAYFSPAATRNPHNPDHTPGGSSSGSAAAVADGMVPVALGTQTAASLIRPAAYCGVVGFKPTRGTFDLTGVRPLAPSFDTLGVISRSVSDAALLTSVLLDEESVEELRPERRPLRVGLCRTPWWHEATADAKHALTEAADTLASAGAVVSELELPPEFARLADAHKRIMAWEAARSCAYERLFQRGQLSEAMAALLDAGARIRRDDYLAAQDTAAAARQSIIGIFAHHDLILAPSAPGEAPKGLSSTGDPIFSRMWSLLHCPSITLPKFRGANGLPVGVQFIGRIGADFRLLAAARRIEALWNGEIGSLID